MVTFQKSPTTATFTLLKNILISVASLLKVIMEGWAILHSLMLVDIAGCSNDLMLLFNHSKWNGQRYGFTLDLIDFFIDVAGAFLGKK